MTARQIVSALSLAILAACGGTTTTGPEAAQSGVTSAAATDADDPQRDLFGQWQVIEAGGETPHGQRMILLFGDDWWQTQSQCVWSTGDFSTDGGKIDFVRLERSYPGLPENRMPTAMCARGLSPLEMSAPDLMSGGRSFAIDGDRLTIAAPEGDLVAKRLPETVTNPMEYTSVDPRTTWGEWRIVSVAGQPVDDAAIVIGFEQVTARIGCTYYQWLAWNDGMGHGGKARREPFAQGCDAPARKVAENLARTIGQTASVTAPAPQTRIFHGPGGEVVLGR
ncbi:hypothetical protein [Croceicoccus bisphenolivorans]|uniref:hypothetical protein n=1 Tax=Croceicoccus bisphenolivorans TaxID=1783232 RepID=UPI000835FF88|nr:hypothetical protein [Croceicoccus bisphenolivorans]